VNTRRTRGEYERNPHATRMIPACITLYPGLSLALPAHASRGELAGELKGLPKDLVVNPAHPSGFGQ